MKGRVLRISLLTIPICSRNFKVPDSVFELIPDSRRSSLNRFGPVKRCLTTRSLDSVTIALIAPTTGHVSLASIELGGFNLTYPARKQITIGLARVKIVSYVHQLTNVQ